MKNKSASIIIGLFVIAIGVAYGLSALNYIHFTLFFKGWWTMFVVLAGVIMLFRKGSNKFISLCVIALGVVLFMFYQGLYVDYIKKLFIPGIIIFFGIGIILNALFSGRKKKIKSIDPVVINNGSLPAHDVSFGEVRPNYYGQHFHGCSMDVTFGTGILDLRHAIIDKDVTISINTAFAGVKIKLPQGCRIDLRTSTSFAGVTNKYIPTETPDVPLVQIYAAASFAGVDIT